MAPHQVILTHRFLATPRHFAMQLALTGQHQQVNNLEQI
jgi:hypothetical protein